MSEQTKNIITGTAITVFLIFIIIRIIHIRQKKNITKMYRRKDILTDREYGFYKKLKPIADKHGLQIFTKVRLADLIEPKDKSNSSLWWECFNKIKSKHIDFALADYDTNIVMLIELDDTSHSRADRQERDSFVNEVLKNTEYTLIRTYGDTEEIKKHL